MTLICFSHSPVVFVTLGRRTFVPLLSPDYCCTSCVKRKVQQIRQTRSCKLHIAHFMYVRICHDQSSMMTQPQLDDHLLSAMPKHESMCLRRRPKKATESFNGSNTWDLENREKMGNEKHSQLATQRETLIRVFPKHNNQEQINNTKEIRKVSPLGLCHTSPTFIY